MTREWIEKEQNGIRALKYLEERCETLAKSIRKSIDDTKNKKMDKFKMLGDRYSTIEDLQEAYGYGEITRKQYDDLRDSLEAFADRVEKEISYKEKALSILLEFVKEVRFERIETEKDVKKWQNIK